MSFYFPSSYRSNFFNGHKQVQAGLSALEDALEAGFEDFKVMNRMISVVVS